MTDHFSFRSHLCIVNELLSINLYELIRNNSFNGFSTVLIRRFTIQILQSLSLLRHHRVVHCDLKPEVCWTFFFLFVRLFTCNVENLRNGCGPYSFFSSRIYCSNIRLRVRSRRLILGVAASKMRKVRECLCSLRLCLADWSERFFCVGGGRCCSLHIYPESILSFTRVSFSYFEEGS